MPNMVGYGDGGEHDSRDEYEYESHTRTMSFLSCLVVVFYRSGKNDTVYHDDKCLDRK